MSRDAITLALCSNGMPGQLAREKACHYAKPDIPPAFEVSRNYRAPQRAVAPARDNGHRPRTGCFDEPTSALDPLMTREVGMLIGNFTTMASLYYASLYTACPDYASDNARFNARSVQKALLPIRLTYVRSRYPLFLLNDRLLSPFF